MRISHKLLWLSLVILVFAATSCSGSMPFPEQAPTTVEADTQSVSPIVTPVDVPVLESVLPTPALESEAVQSSEGAVVEGTLLLFDPINFAPEEDGIYLVPVDSASAVDEGVSFAVPSIGESSMQAQVDETTGDFLFRDVPSGFYALVARTDRGQQISIRDLATHTTTFVDVSSEDVGVLIDIGKQRLP